MAILSIHCRCNRTILDNILPEICFLYSAPGSWSVWSSPKCSVYCGSGVLERTRECLGPVHGVSYHCQDASEEDGRVDCAAEEQCINGEGKKYSHISHSYKCRLFGVDCFIPEYFRRHSNYSEDLFFIMI